MGAIKSLFAKPEDNSAAVKKQAEGASNPMYGMAALGGGGMLYEMCKKAMITKNYKELDDAIRQKVPPYLYNGGKGRWIHCAHIACIRNSIRGKSKQFPFIRELEDPTTFRYDGSEILERLVAGQSYETHPHLYTQHCWDIENRGCVGETVFHVCFLQGSAIHLHLAKRLLKHYPLLLNDIYLSDEYYGENVLHMAAVAEDPSVVKWLLEEGSDINRRCYGNFFTCHDQQPFRNDSLEMEEVVLRDKTDYYGYVAWGEYPHCFAAVLNQEECYRLILAKGGNHDLVDINGCTVAHILVVFTNIKMFDMAVECGAAMNIENKLGLTPLTVAAYLAKCDMFFHIASIEREVYWQLGNVTCSAYPLKYLDTINSETGELQTQSALNLIVFGPKLEHLDLIENVIVDLLNVKWKTFIQKKFYTQFFIFFCFFLLSSAVFLLREQYPGPPEDDCTDSLANSSLALNSSLGLNSSLVTSLPSSLPSLLGETDRAATAHTAHIEEGLLQDPGTADFQPEGSGDSGMARVARMVEDLLPSPESLLDMETNLLNSSLSDSSPESNTSEAGGCGEEDSCFHHTYKTRAKQVRAGCEVGLVLWSLAYLFESAYEASFLGKKIFLDNLGMCPSRVIFLLGCITCQAMVPARLLCLPNLEDRLALLVMLSTGPYFLFFCRGFKLVGPMVIMIYRMLAQDLARFFTVFVIFVMGFSQAFFIIFQSFEFDTEVDDVPAFIDEETGDITCDPDEEENCELNPMPIVVESLLITFQMATMDPFAIWGALAHTQHEILGKIHWGLFVLIVFLLLLNLLIAMMGDTYAKIAAIKNEWMRQWAKTLLITERSIPPKERLRQQDLYADRNSDGDKALVMKQFLSAEKLEEIDEIIEMKMTHRKNIERRKAKFGFDSVSKMGLNMVGAAVVVADASDGTEPENPYGDDDAPVAPNPAFAD